MDTFLHIFVSVFFVFGLYCAAIEFWTMTLKIYRFYRRRRIDKKHKKG